MPTLLGIDWAAEMAAEFGGDVADATFTKSTPGSYDPNRPGAGTQPDVDEYACKAVALGFEHKLVDGERQTHFEFRVVILRGTILDDDDEAADVLPGPNDTVSVPPPGGTTPVTGTIAKVEAVTAAFVTVVVKGPTSS